VNGLWCLLLWQASWIAEGPSSASFRFGAEEIEVTGAGSYPNWIRSEREYENLELTFEYKLAQWSEAAVVLRAPKWGRPMRAGVAVTLAHDFHKKTGRYVTGAVSGVAPPRQMLPESWGVWKKAVLTLQGATLRVTIDGQLVQQAQVERAGPGYVVFPDLGHRYWIRNVAMEDRGQPTKIVRPFAGKRVQRGGSGTWTVDDDHIRGANGHSVLYAEPRFEDFHLALYVRSHQRVNAGLFLRGDAREGQSRGFEVQIYSPPDAVYPTGSLYNHVRSDIEVDYEERWFYLEVFVRGRTAEVRIDGRVVATSASLPADVAASGQIGLQIHSDAAWVEFDDIRVRELLK
jgi:hypothetical protein